MTTVTELSPLIGVELSGLTGVDLVDRTAADECVAALERHGVVIYREAHLSEVQFVAFSRLLGEVMPNPTSEHQLPEIATITLDPAKTRALLACYRQGNFLWHIDGATEEVPQKATLLTARQVDPAGGDTEFASTYAAYAALPEDRQAWLSTLFVVHSFGAAQLRAHPEATADEKAGWDRVPSRVHPLVWTHRNGRKSLVLGATADSVVGMPEVEGRELLEELLAWSTQPQFALRHQWRIGDVVIWDNTGMLHRALPFEPTSPRLMHRTTLVGEEPIR